TLAMHGRVDDETLDGLERLRSSGRKLILVTGRELDDLCSVFPHVHLFDRVVAENGALLYRPGTREEKLLGTPPPEAFIKELRARNIMPLSVGRAIVATRTPHETDVIEVIRDLGLELQVIFNKGAVMILPAGVNKATGLMAALDELSLSPHNVVAVGDGENDHALLRLCEYAVAVSDALPMLKEQADYVTKGECSAGVLEIIEELLADDLRQLEGRLTRHHILLGARESGEEIRISPYGLNLLLAGSSGSGKSTLATGILERLAEQAYQFCIIDPEGDYEAFEGAIILGNSQRVPSVAEIVQLLEEPQANAVINLVGLPLQDRPSFFIGLLPRLQELRARAGRPHWIVVDEVHHLLPATWEPAPLTLTRDLEGMILITVHPNQVSHAVLSEIDIAIAVGETPGETLQTFGDMIGHPLSTVQPTALQPGEALMWRRRAGLPPFCLRVAPSRMDRRRHRRKYAQGELSPDRSFYFKGPNGALSLRAQNLMMFIQLADGVDDATWIYHLRQGDYSRWFREAIKDDTLADQAQRIEAMKELSPADSRTLIKAAIEQHYTLPG
ncbi:MAG: phosphoglycolate phosphatase, partial [Nitrospiraceae bacterium]